MGNKQTKDVSTNGYDFPRAKMDKFLRSTIEMKNFDELRKDKYEFLCELVRSYDSHIPFQNLTHCSVPFAERKTPTLQDNIDAVCARLGGRCWTLNSVMYVLLKELGYDVTPRLGSVAMEGASNHMFNLVRNVKVPGDTYLVDCGFSNTAHPPIPMDFEAVSPEYQFGYQHMRFYRRDADGMIIRQERIDPATGPKFPTQDGDWDNCIYLDVNTETDIPSIQASIEKAMYADPKAKFNVTRRITGTSSALGKFVAIYDDKLFVESEEGKLEKTPLENDDELIEAAKKYFPYFPAETVQKAYDIWRKYDKQG